MKRWLRLVIGMATLAVAWPGYAEIDPARLPTKPKRVVRRALTRHILISYKDAQYPVGGATRTKAEALALAEKVVEEARQKDADFAALAKKYSDSPTKNNDALLGLLRRDRDYTSPKVAYAVLQMDVGQVSDPVEAKAGYQIIMRIPVREIAVATIKLKFQGMKGPDRLPPSKISRTKLETLELAGKIVEEARAAEADFASIYAKYASQPDAHMEISGGRLVFGDMGDPLGFREDLFELPVNGVSDPIDTPFCIWIAKRLPSVYIEQIFIAYESPDIHNWGQGRTPQEAEELANKVYDELVVDPGKFDQLIKKYSAIRKTRLYTGPYLIYPKGEHPKLEEPALELQVGEVCYPMEYNGGFCIMKRVD